MQARTIIGRNSGHAPISEILARWNSASPEERVKAIVSIGLTTLLAALPDDWWPLIEQHVADRRNRTATVTVTDPLPDDLSIPDFLRRKPEAIVETTTESEVPEEHPNEQEEVADEEVADEDEAEDDYEPPEFKPKRPPKLIEQSSTIGEALDSAFADLQDLAEQCREIVDNAPESLQQTDRIQTFEASADELENLEAPDAPDALSKLSVKYALPKRRYCSRALRASDDATMLEACIKVLKDIPDEDEAYADAQALMSDLQNVIDSVEQCRFPGMYG